MAMYNGKQWISDFKQGETDRNKYEVNGGDKIGTYPSPKYQDKTKYTPETYRNPKWTAWDN